MSAPLERVMRRRSGPEAPPLTIAGAGRFTEVSRAATLLLWAIFGVFASLLLWSALASIDIVTRASGKVVPSGRLQVIQSLEGGVVEKIEARQGEPVKQGDVLVVLSTMQSGSDLQARTQQYWTLVAKSAALRGLVTGKAPRFDDIPKAWRYPIVADESAAWQERMAEYQSQKSVLDAQVSQRRREIQELQTVLETTRRGLGLAQSEREIMAKLVSRGLEPQLELLRLDRSISDAQGKVTSAEVSIERARAGLQEAQSKSQAFDRQFKAEALAEANKLQIEIRSLKEALPALQDKVTRAELKAPVSGVLNRLLVTTQGAVVKPGELVAEVVPEGDQLVVEAMVHPKDIAFIAVGQKAVVKITAYDYAVYGALEGVVASIGADAVPSPDGKEAFYQVRIETKDAGLESLGRKLPILPGMQAEVDIVNGSRTVFHYLTRPLVGVKENAFRER